MRGSILCDLNVGGCGESSARTWWDSATDARSGRCRAWRVRMVGRQHGSSDSAIARVGRRCIDYGTGRPSGSFSFLACSQHLDARMARFQRCRRLRPQRIKGHWSSSYLDQTTTASFIDRVVGVFDGRARGGVRRYLDATLQASQWRDSSPLTHAQSLVHPMVVVTGAQDSMTPPGHGKRLAQAAPNAQLLEFERMGHSPSPQDWKRILTESSQAFDLSTGP